MEDRRPSTRGINTVVFWMIVCLVVVVDQGVKAAVHEHLALGVARADFIPGLIDLYLVYNTGAAFSIGEGAGILFVVIAVAVVGLFSAMVWRERDLPLSVVIPMGCVAGGGLGNMIDRLVDGAVTDYLSFHFWTSFPVFNIADVFVTCGCVLLIIGYLRWDSGRE